jgi:hypothetical protein
MGDFRTRIVDLGDDHEMLLLRSAGDRWPRAALILGSEGTVGRINLGLLRKMDRNLFLDLDPEDGRVPSGAAPSIDHAAFLRVLLELSQVVPSKPTEAQTATSLAQLRALADELRMLIDAIPELREEGGLEVVDDGMWERGRWFLRTTAVVGKEQKSMVFFLVPFRPQGFEGPVGGYPPNLITRRPICSDGRAVSTNARADGTPVIIAGRSGIVAAKPLTNILDFIADDEVRHLAAALSALRARLDGRSPTAAYNGIIAGRFRMPQETSGEIHRRMRLVTRALRVPSDHEELAFIAPSDLDFEKLCTDVITAER